MSRRAVLADDGGVCTDNKAWSYAGRSPSSRALREGTQQVLTNLERTRVRWNPGLHGRHLPRRSSAGGADWNATEAALRTSTPWCSADTFGREATRLVSGERHMPPVTDRGRGSRGISLRREDSICEGRLAARRNDCSAAPKRSSSPSPPGRSSSRAPNGPPFPVRLRCRRTRANPSLPYPRA